MVIFILFLRLLLLIFNILNYVLLIKFLGFLKIDIVIYFFKKINCVCFCDKLEKILMKDKCKMNCFYFFDDVECGIDNYYRVYIECKYLLI